MSSDKAKMARSFYEKNKTLLMIIGFIALLALIFAILCYTNEDFSNSIFGPGTNLKDLDILLFMSPNCQWSQQTMKLLKDNNKLDDVTIINVDTEDGKKMATMYGATRGSPTFVSKKYNTGTVGYKDTIKDIVQDLTTNNKPPPESIPELQPNQQQNLQPTENFEGGGNSVPTDEVKGLRIVVFYKDSCPYCVKAKKDLESLGLMSSVELQDVNSTEGKNRLRDFKKEGTSVPLYASSTTGKTSLGYKPFKDVIRDLTMV
jgi:glutaredoxin